MCVYIYDIALIKPHGDFVPHPALNLLHKQTTTFAHILTLTHTHIVFVQPTLLYI